VGGSEDKLGWVFATVPTRIAPAGRGEAQARWRPCLHEPLAACMPACQPTHMHLPTCLQHSLATCTKHLLSCTPVAHSFPNPTSPLLPHSHARAGGNNENEAAFSWFPEPLLNPRLYAADFSKLFADVVQQVGCCWRSEGPAGQ